MAERSWVRWVIAGVVALALVGLVAFARGAPRAGRRVPDRGHAGAPLVPGGRDRAGAGAVPA